MAIQIDLETSNFGIPFTGAYFRIATASISRQRASAFGVMIDDIVAAFFAVVSQYVLVFFIMGFFPLVT